MKHFDRQINRDFSNAAILCVESVYPITGGNDSSKDYWLLKRDGTLVDDNSADLHWEAAEGKVIETFAGMGKEESVVSIVGGEETAKNKLAAKGVVLTGKETTAELGALVIANFTQSTAAGGSLSLDFSSALLSKDWKSINTSYVANETFFSEHFAGFVGKESLKTAANGGREVTTKAEYYAILYNPLREALGLSGTNYANDPLGYLKANTTEVAGHGLSKPVTVRKDMVADLEKALDDTKAQGGTIPKVGSGGGLYIRFEQNEKADSLKISNHALGRAIDFDPDTNRQNFIDKDSAANECFSTYIESNLGKSANLGQGWEDNKKLAQLISGFPQYIDNRETSLEQMIKSLARAPASIQSSSIPAMQAELLQIQTAKELNYPSLSFTFDKIFTENMRESFNWGGDWWRQKDYMHFEQ